MVEEVNLSMAQMGVALIILLVLLVFAVRSASKATMDVTVPEPEEEQRALTDRDKVVMSRYGAVRQIQHH